MKTARFLILGAGFVIGTPAFADAGSPDNVASSERTANSVQSVVSTNLYNLLAARFDPLTSLRRLSLLDNRIYLASAGEVSGLGVADTPRGISLWGNAGRNSIKNSFSRTAYDGYTNTFALGGDYQLTKQLVAGLSGTYSRTALDTPFNQGGSKTDGYALMPYAQYSFNDWLNGDLSAGYVWSNTDLHRIVAGTLVTGLQDSSGAIATANLNAQTWKGSWLLAGKAGLLYSRDKRSNFVESDGTVNIGSTSGLAQGKLGGSVGYWMDGILPTLSLTYSYDIRRDPVVIAGGGAQPANDRDDLTASLAFNAYDVAGCKGLTVALSASKEFLRKELSNEGISLNVRYAY